MYIMACIWRRRAFTRVLFSCIYLDPWWSGEWPDHSSFFLNPNEFNTLTHIHISSFLKGKTMKREVYSTSHRREEGQRVLAYWSGVSWGEEGRTCELDASVWAVSTGVLHVLFACWVTSGSEAATTNRIFRTNSSNLLLPCNLHHFDPDMKKLHNSVWAAEKRRFQPEIHRNVLSHPQL